MRLPLKMKIVRKNKKRRKTSKLNKFLPQLMMPKKIRNKLKRQASMQGGRNR